ncbi:glycoside hydrolase family 13 protein [Thiospirochaeta perfilievii]|uniref:Glycoside hydrolase family 13 protein n=1 Tax=Thiospirochaeta perfilievii TaxID=252967 RepID=A0A5C1Q9B7_9SPIO|nr:glycoside hydrolase family 13 protein [Thiospirochaeta perfilievii]QEN04723.1 glycoside hydrolase family 13 protein [Thiospirochaeta perfilievii]
MNIQAIMHKPKSNYCYAYTRDNIHIRIRTAKDDVDRVLLVYGDKYEWEKKITTEMYRAFSDDLYDYYTISITATNNRLSYYFLLENRDESHYFTEWGVNDDIPEDELHLVQFHYPYINVADIHEIPDWVRDTVFYQIFPERYDNGNPDISPKNIVPWDSKPERDSFFGGDLQGIINHLDHIKDLGISGIYMTPIFKSTTNHKYDTTDYYTIDPNFGDKDTLKKLVSECHKRGIKVVLDAVYNHCGYKFDKFQDVVEKGKSSKYYNWFYIEEESEGNSEIKYEKFAFEQKMPKLRTSNPEVQKYLLDVASYWIKETDIDGWRLDVSNEVDHMFWKAFRKEIKSIKPDAYIVGENWHDSQPWLQGDQFDGIMNYPVNYSCLKYFAKSSITTETFKRMINESLMRNTWQVNEAMMNLLDSHDTARFVNLSDMDFRKSLLAMSFLLTFVGSTSIYYGTEIGLTGDGDPDCRKGMNWDKSTWNMTVYNMIQSLLQIRNNNKPLTRGSFSWIDCDLLAYKRSLGNEDIYVYINNNDNCKYCTLTNGTYIDLLKNEEIVVSADKNRVEFSEYSVNILKKKN